MNVRLPFHLSTAFLHTAPNAAHNSMLTHCTDTALLGSTLHAQHCMGAARLLLAQSHLLAPCWQPGTLGFLVVEVLSNVSGSVLCALCLQALRGSSAACPAAPAAASCGHIPIPAGPGRSRGAPGPGGSCSQAGVCGMRHGWALPCSGLTGLVCAAFM